MVTHEAWLQVGTVIKATLLPTDTSGNASRATTLFTTCPTHSADAGHRGRAGTSAVAIATTTNAGTHSTVRVGVGLTGVAVASPAISALTRGTVTSIAFAKIVVQTTG